MIITNEGSGSVYTFENLEHDARWSDRNIEYFDTYRKGEHYSVRLSTEELESMFARANGMDVDELKARMSGMAVNLLA